MQGLAAILVVFPALLGHAASQGIMGCYFGSWAHYRAEAGAFDIENIDPFLCTHLFYAFTGVNNQTWTVEVLDPSYELCPPEEGGVDCAFDRFVALKEQNPELKTLLSVGGWNEGSVDFSQLVAHPSNRASFVQSSVDLLLNEGFDGLDIDWEFPTTRGGVPEDKENLILLLGELRTALDEHGLLLTAALAPVPPTADDAYDVPGLVSNLDFLNIMTYDFHGAWEDFTHINSPLCGYPEDTTTFDNNVVFAIDYWIGKGAPPAKLVMGVPAYARCYTLDDVNSHGVLASASTPGAPGPYTGEAGTLATYEICERLQDTVDCSAVQEADLNEPYMYCQTDSIWCSYEDHNSVHTKGRFAKHRELGGVMVWAIDTDDFAGTCTGGGSFGLITALKEGFEQPADPNETFCV